MPSGADTTYCPYFHTAIELIGRRWSGAILLALFADVQRFSDLRDAIPGLSDRLLTERLRELEEAGIVSRSSECRDIHYGLTDKGRALDPVFQELFDWTNHWAELEAEPDPS